MARWVHQWMRNASSHSTGPGAYTDINGSTVCGMRSASLPLEVVTVCATSVEAQLLFHQQLHGATTAESTSMSAFDVSAPPSADS
eukprot:825674-Amphidinium_carterae.1